MEMITFSKAPFSFLSIYKLNRLSWHCIFRRLSLLLAGGISRQMDESWRMRMGMPELPRRRSTEGPSMQSLPKGAGPLNPGDFSDVFGGPPRSVLSRQFSSELEQKQYDFFYEEMFRPPEFFSSAKNAGRSLPVFRIPESGEGFYNDIFGSDHERRSRDRSGHNSKGKSKSNSSSVLSSEEASPFRHVIGNDVVLSSFAAKLRYRFSCTTVFGILKLFWRFYPCQCGGSMG